MKRKISIVIPIYNETENVKRIIENLEKVENIYEVIFVDGFGDSRAEEIIKNSSNKLNAVYLRSEKGRSVQMNEGYRYSSGEVVLFLHCDSIIEEDVMFKISESIEKGTEFGCLSIYFDDSRLLMKICGYMSRRRALRRKIAFGDQGMFFTREYFEELGGFKEIPLMEDYDISIRAKEKFPVTQIDSKIVTSSRKYYEGNGIFNRGILSFVGVLKTMYDMQVYQHRFRKGVSPEEIVKEYYRE